MASPDELPEEAQADQPENGEILEVDHEVGGEVGDNGVWEG